MTDKCSLHEVLWTNAEKRFTEQSASIEKIEDELEAKMSLKTFWASIGLLSSILLTCFGGLFYQGVTTQEKISRVELKVAVIETRVDIMLKSKKLKIENK